MATKKPRIGEVRTFAEHGMEYVQVWDGLRWSAVARYPGTAAMCAHNLQLAIDDILTAEQARAERAMLSLDIPAEIG